jgi:hypothetical protein
MGDVLDIEIAGLLVLAGCYGYESLHHCAGAVRRCGWRGLCRRGWTKRLRVALRTILLPSLAIAIGYGLLCAGKLRAKGLDIVALLAALV